MIVDGQFQHFEQLKLLNTNGTDKIVYIGLAAAVDSKFDWEKIVEQLTAISINKESSP